MYTISFMFVRVNHKEFELQYSFDILIYVFDRFYGTVSFVWNSALSAMLADKGIEGTLIWDADWVNRSIARTVDSYEILQHKKH